MLKQSTARNLTFLMVDSTDHVTGKTGLTVTVTISKDGGSFAAAGGTVSEISSGWYKIALTTTDTNTVGDIALHCTGTGADPTDIRDQVSAQLADDLATATNLAAAKTVVDAIKAGLIVRSGTAQGGSTTYILLDSGASSVADYYTGAYVAITSGAGAGQVRQIVYYSGGTDKEADVSPEFITATDNTSVFAIVAFPPLAVSLSSTAVTYVTDTILNKAFMEDTGLTYGDAVAGSVVKEIADNASGGSVPTVQEIVDGVLDEALSSHTTAGTLGKAVADIDGNTDTEIAAIKTVVDAVQAKTDNLPSDPADASVIAGLIDDLPTADENADALLARNIAGGSSSGRIVTDALRSLRNRVKNNGDGTASVYEEDDTTVAWSATMSTDVSALPITEVNPG